jgi:hypothetical protein
MITAKSRAERVARGNGGPYGVNGVDGETYQQEEKHKTDDDRHADPTVAGLALGEI